MIKCQVCYRQFKRINIFHLKTHDIKNETEYLKLYPGSKLFDENYTKKISNSVKTLWKDKDYRISVELYLKNKPDDVMDKIKKSVSKLHENGHYDHIYTEERNKKISIGKKKWWKTQDSKLLMKKWLGDYIGSERHIENTKINGALGFLANKKSGRWKQTQPEKDYEMDLIANKIKYISEYKVDGKFFDFYLVAENKLVEIDGEFYHTETLDECRCDFQERNYFNDIKKNEIAKNNGYKLQRIRV
jgi:very-short-patch-repair endonuclease